MPGDTIGIIVYADQAGSQLDAIADLLDGNGNTVATIDDAVGLDPLIIITTTTNSSSYYLRIRGVGRSTGEYTAGVYFCWKNNGC